MDFRSRITAVALLVAWPSLGAAAESQPRATMDRIFDAVALLLPLSLDEARFSSPANRPSVEQALGTLVDSVAALEKHAKRRSEGFEFLSHELASDVRRIREDYEAQRYAEARFGLHMITDTCFACHSRLPPERAFRFANRLLARPELAALPAPDRARLQVATRQFEPALASFEAILKDPGTSPAQMDLSGTFVDYLTVSLRVLRDPRRPIGPLRAVAARTDAPRYLRRRLDGWVGALEGLAATPPPATLASGRTLVARAQDLAQYPGDRDGLVYDLAASGALHAFIDATPRGQRPELAEAYYLLGITESRVPRSWWVSETEHYLKTSIRLAPGKEVAGEAYTLLEELVIASFTGSSGEHVPADVRTELDELHRLAFGETYGPAGEAPRRSR